MNPAAEITDEAITTSTPNDRETTTRIKMGKKTKQLGRTIKEISVETIENKLEFQIALGLLFFGSVFSFPSCAT